MRQNLKLRQVASISEGGGGEGILPPVPSTVKLRLDRPTPIGLIIH